MLTPPTLPVHFDVPASLASFATGAHVQSFAGVPVWKLAADLDRYASVIATSRPDVIVETGTMWGGSALWFESRGLDVVTVDVDPRPVYPLARSSCTRTTWLVGASTDPSMVAQVAALVVGRRVMVSLDSEHSAPHVAAEIAAYGPLVSPGCYLVVEDGIFDLAPSDEGRAQGGALVPQVGGPLRAVADVLADDPRWRRDVEIEQMDPLSYFPAGWWMRSE
jgi:cephalosporin hydroxylase